MVQKQKTPQLIDSQLFEDEHLVWWGQPVPSYIARRVRLGELLPNILAIGFAIFFIIFTQNMLAEMRGFESLGRSGMGNLFETMFPIFFLAIPLIMIGSAAWSASKPLRDWYLATKTYYALTNKRAIIIVDAFSTEVRSYYDEQMKQLDVKHYNDGIGDIVFASKTKTRTYRHGKRGGINVSFTDDGPQVFTGQRHNTVSYQVPEGFFAVPDARIVEDFIAQMFFDDDKKRT
ncbi:MAG: hypothetical protein AAF846_17470 [Chloroflexota bacterium]